MSSHVAVGYEDWQPGHVNGLGCALRTRFIVVGMVGEQCSCDNVDGSNGVIFCLNAMFCPGTLS